MLSLHEVERLMCTLMQAVLHKAKRGWAGNFARESQAAATTAVSQNTATTHRRCMGWGHRGAPIHVLADRTSMHLIEWADTCEHLTTVCALHVLKSGQALHGMLFAPSRSWRAMPACL